MNTYHPDRATAIQFEIVKPIEDWVIPAAGIPTEFDIDAIADEVIKKSEGGYVRIVGVDRFWEIVASHHIGSKVPKIFWDLDKLFDGEEEEVAYLMQWSDDMGSFIEIDAEYIELSKELDPYAAAEKRLVDRNGFELDDVTLYKD